MNDTTVLLAGHGSRNHQGNQEIQNFAAQWRERHPVRPAREAGS